MQQLLHCWCAAGRPVVLQHGACIGRRCLLLSPHMLIATLLQGFVLLAVECETLQHVQHIKYLPPETGLWL